MARLAFETLLGLQYIADPEAYTTKAKVTSDTAMQHWESIAEENEAELPMDWYAEVKEGKNQRFSIRYWSPTSKLFRTLAAAKAACM